MQTRRRYNFRVYEGDTLVSKECGKCLTYKRIEEFTEDSSHKDGYTPKCKDCISGYKRVYWKDNPGSYNKEYQQEYYNNNRESLLKYFKEYYIKNNK